MPIIAAIKQFHRDLQARAARHFRTQEIVRVMSATHMQELAGTPGEQWALVKQKQAKEIQAVRDGKFDIVDRRTWCYSADTEVLTGRGWIPWPKVTSADTFAVQSNGRMDFCKAIKLFKGWYKGDLLHFCTHGADILVTPDHRMYGRQQLPRKRVNGHNLLKYSPPQFFSAEDVAKLRRNSRKVDPCKFKVPVMGLPAVGTLPQKRFVMLEAPKVKCGKATQYKISLKDWVAFLGIYAAEGSRAGAYIGSIQASACPIPLYKQVLKNAKARKGYRGYHVIICQNRTSKYWQEIADLLTRMGLNWTEKKAGFLIWSRAIWEACGEAGWSSYEKKIPQWVKDLPPEYLEIFIKWAMKGDGWLHRGQRRYKTVSKALADDMQELFAKTGSAAYITLCTDRPGTVGRDIAPMYTLYEFVRPEVGTELSARVPYNNYVYCARVPGGLLYVRRNGKPVWSGNSYPYLPEALHRLNQPILKNTPYNLARFSETPIPRRAINLIKNAILELDWQVEPVPEMEDEGSVREREKRIRIATDCFKRPNNVDSFRTFAEAVIEDIILGGYGCIEPRMTPYYKRPWKMWPVQGSTIRIYADWSEGMPDRPRFAQMTGLKGERGIVAFLSDELIYIKDNSRSSTPFGLGKLEVAFNTVNAFLGVQDMASKAGSDQVHKTFLWWEQPQNQAHVQTVRRHIQNELEGQAKVSLIAGLKKPEVIPVQSVLPDDLLLEWQEFLIRIIANAFDLSPFSLGLEKDVNRNTGLIMALSDFRGAVVPMAMRVQESFTRDLLNGFMSWKDLQFTFQGLDDPDALTKVQIQQRQYQMNSLTPDEIRESEGRPPLPEGWGKITFGMMQILIQEAMALVKAKMGGGASMGSGGGFGSGGGSASGGGMGNSLPGTGGAGAISPSAASSGGQRGFQGSLIGEGEFTPDDITQMTPEEVQYFQEMGMLPPTGDLANAMDMQQPGILEQLTEELTEFFEQAEVDEKEDEEKPQKVSKGDEKLQVQKFKESLRKPTVVEQYLNDRYRGFPRPNESNTNMMPGEQKMMKVQRGKRGKYPRSGGDKGTYK